MRIGQLADESGVPTRTIRFYERRGLLAKPQRSDNGYREYGEGVVSRLGFIRASQTAGLTLAEIASIVEIRDAGSAPCEHVDSLLKAKLDEVRERRAQLDALEAELNALIERSRTLDPADCGEGDVCHIIDGSGSHNTEH